MPVKQLYESVKKDIRDTNEFLEVLDCLFVLDVIDYDYDRKELFYAV